MHLNACTIVSKNYICFARVLARSFARHQPGGRFFVLLVDRNDQHLDAEAEGFEIVEIEELTNVPRMPSFLFKYTLLECNTAVKPFFMEYLIERHGLDSLTYFDPDILITGSLDPLARLVEDHSVVLTPHLDHPIDDELYPGEQAILQSGSYNLGFVALRADDTALRLLRWWQGRLYDKCLVRIADGLFVDQKWMDLVPGMFGGWDPQDGELNRVYVLTHPGYNVAYWNLHGRRVTVGDDGDATVDGAPLVFFHFSGIQPESLAGVSKHQNRFQLADLGDAAQLYRRYAALVIEAGYHECRPWPYAFGRFTNGVAIPDAARSLYHGLGADRQDRFGDPFDADAGDPSFFAWIQGPEPGRDAPGDGPYLSRFLAHLHAERDDLRGGFPDLDGPGLANFSSWLMAAGRHELKLDDAFVEPVSRGGAPRVGLGRRIKNRLRRAYHSPLGQRAKSAAVGALGPARTEALKRRLRPRPQAPPKEPPQRGPDVRRLGVNLVGYLRAETGMGEAGRSLARAFESAGVPLSLHSLDLGVVARQDDATYGDAVSDFPYDINLFVVNADQVPPVLDHLGPEVWAGRYNIGLWLWELEDFPPHLHPSFEHLHEIWTPSSFCVDAIGGVAPIPVRRVPLPIVPRTPTSNPTGDVEWRRRLGLPEDAFLFLYIFNYLSYFERKNPLAAVRAFRNAFGDDPSKLLLLKTSQSDFAPDDHRRLLAEIDGAANVVLLEDYLSRDDLDGLISTCDAYVSPHRSEGFGLTLAEAMAAGKAVLAAPWSGNADFFGINNGYPVRYSLVTLEQDAGPYPAGSRWADIDIGHLAECMAHVVSDGDGRRRLGRRARADIEAELGPEAVGRRLARRFDDIVRRQSRSLRPPLPPSAR